MIRRYRSRVKAHQAGGVVLWLSVLWTGLGVLGAGYDFVQSVHVPEASYIGIQPWAGESGVIYAAADLGALTWLLLTIPRALWH